MKAYRKFYILAAAAMLLMLLSTNVLVLNLNTGIQRSYRVEISRAAGEISEYGLDALDLSAYPSLLQVTTGAGAEFLKGGQSEYAIREIDGKLYRFDYRIESDNHKLLRILNLCMGGSMVLLLGLLFFLQKRIVAPFETMRHLPAELAKGNLTMPILQQKNRYFGDFLWGMDLLREKLEQQKKEELKLQKEKKSLILSLAHDIKTPLSAIKLYARALSKNLYKDPQRQEEIAEKIGCRADEIEDYIGKIMAASREDFLHLEVHAGEFYLKEVKEEINAYYEDKLHVLKIPFSSDFGENCILQGDRDRVVEILQNLMENAIKYGDGGKITISSAQEANCRILTVTNENCSLEPSELPHIFDSFWRGANSSSVQGSGLGLYICRQLAGAMGGEVFAEICEKKMAVSLVLSKV